jgi:hypothetical protein
MILIYLVLGQDRYGEYDAYYFPESDIPISRCSEPKNYRDLPTPYGKTVLCAELPCAVDDPVGRPMTYRSVSWYAIRCPRPANR